MCSGGALSFFDKLLDFLATFLSDSFVEVWAVAIARGFATFLSTLLTDLLVELVTVSLFCREPTLTTNLFVEFGPVLFLYRLAAFWPASRTDMPLVFFGTSGVAIACSLFHCWVAAQRDGECLAYSRTQVPVFWLGGGTRIEVTFAFSHPYRCRRARVSRRNPS